MGKAWSHERTGGKEEWLTPPYILKSLGPFDLDPCACAEPRPWDTATLHIAPPDDGLQADWNGRVWLNPPYGNETGRWLVRMAEHGIGIALIFARTDTKMFHEYVFPYVSGLLFLHGRLYFYYPSGLEAGPAGAPSVLLAYDSPKSERTYNADALRNSGLPGFFVPMNAECFATGRRRR